MTDERIQAIEELLQDEAFVAEAQKVQDLGALADLFVSHGVTITAEELDALQKVANGEEGELGEDDLENVAGGCIIWRPRLPFPFPRPLPLPIPKPGPKPIPGFPKPTPGFPKKKKK